MANSSQNRNNLKIRALRLTSRSRTIADLDNYLVELNLFEDMFSNAIYGNIVVNDHRNLIRELQLEGDETLYIDLLSDRFVDSSPMRYRKEFRVFSVSDRIISHEKGSQIYTLNFCSKEVFRDTLQPLYRPFDGETISDVVELIYNEYLLQSRYPGGPDNTLTILDPTANPVNFISPGWTPFKCINWLASKSISANGSACNYLFWETSKGYYFGSVEEIFRRFTATKNTIGYYTYRQKDINYDALYADLPDEGVLDLFSIDSINIENASDQLKLTSEGELASTMLTIDINKKEFFNTVYDHSARFEDYAHLTAGGAAPWGPRATVNPKNSLAFYPRNSKLFDDFTDNVNEVYERVFGPRYSNLRDVQNFKLNITIPGRTDLQAGNIIELLWPDTVPFKTSSSDGTFADKRYSGYYLVTAIHHKINLLNHNCTLEVVRDSFPNILGADGTVSWGLVLDPTTGELVPSI